MNWWSCVILIVAARLFATQYSSIYHTIMAKSTDQWSACFFAYVVGGVQVVITCVKFHIEIYRGYDFTGGGGRILHGLIVQRSANALRVIRQVAGDILKKLPLLFDMDKTRKMFGISISPTTVVLLQVVNTKITLSSIHSYITVYRVHCRIRGAGAVARSSVIKPPLTTARAALCDGHVHLFVCLFVCLSVCRQIAKTQFSQKLSNLELYWRPIGSRTRAFQRTHNWTPKIQDGWDPPSWKSTWRHFFCWGWSDLDNFADWCRMACRLRWYGRNWNQM